MKFCENCGAKLEDNASFCEECGTKQETVQQNDVQAISHGSMPSQSSTTTSQSVEKSTKKQMPEWLFFILLIVCSPLVLYKIIWSFSNFWFWIIWLGAPIAVIITMWSKKKWKPWIKIAVTLVYTIMYFTTK